MAAIEERVAYLEGRVEEHGQMINGVREAVSSLERRMDARFEAIDRRFEAIDRRFEAIDLRLDAMDGKISRQFVWLVGIQVMTLAAVVTSLAAMLAAVGGN